MFTNDERTNWNKPDVPISAHCCPIFYILDIIGNLKTVLSCNTKYVGVGGVWRKKTPPLYFFSSLWLSFFLFLEKWIISAIFRCNLWTCDLIFIYFYLFYNFSCQWFGIIWGGRLKMCKSSLRYSVFTVIETFKVLVYQKLAYVIIWKD